MMTLIPAVLVLIAGSGVIRTKIDRWFNAPMDDVLSSANAIAGDYYQERQRPAAQADRLARALAISHASTCARCPRFVGLDVLQQRVSLVEVFRAEAAGARAAPRSGRRRRCRGAAAGHPGAAFDSLAAQGSRAPIDSFVVEPLRTAAT